MPDTIEYFTSADETPLAVHVMGSGPPVVCIPGGPARASAYLEDLGGLSKTHTMLRLDTRGTGFSELPTQRALLAFPRLAEDIEALRLARGLDSIDLVGHSAGCYLSMVYAARYPDRIRHLILLTPSARAFAPADEDIVAIRASRADEPWYADAAELEAEIEMMPQHRRERPHRGLRVFAYGRWDERAQAHADSTDNQMSLRASAGFGDPEFDQEQFVADLAKFSAPTLVIVGTLDGQTGVRSGYVVADMMGNASVVEIEGAGHYPWIDTPDELRDAMVTFLAT